MKTWKRKKQDVKFKKLHVVRGDKVKVIAGKEKGKTGTILQVVRNKGRVVVEKVNLVKRHSKGTSAQNPGGIIEKEASVHLSNVLPYCGKCTDGVRISRKVLDDGSIVRACKKCGSQFKPSSK
jgi:large subunit ribosomal protein L24